MYINVTKLAFKLKRFFVFFCFFKCMSYVCITFFQAKGQITLFDLSLSFYTNLFFFLTNEMHRINRIFYFHSFKVSHTVGMMSPLLEINENGRKENNNHKINNCIFRMVKLKGKINKCFVFLIKQKQSFVWLCFWFIWFSEWRNMSALFLQSFVHKISDTFFVNV